MAAARQEFLLRIRAEAGPVPPVIRLRRFLKLALRTFGLRVVSIEQLHDADAKSAAAEGRGRSANPGRCFGKNDDE